MAKQEQNRDNDDAKKSPNNATNGDEIEVADSEAGTGSNDQPSTEAANTAEESAAFSVLVPDQKEIDVEQADDENSNLPSSAATTVADAPQRNLKQDHQGENVDVAPASDPDESNDDQKKSTDISDDGNDRRGDEMHVGNGSSSCQQDSKHSAAIEAGTDDSNAEESSSSFVAHCDNECDVDVERGDDATSSPPSSTSNTAPAAAAQWSLKTGDAPASGSGSDEPDDRGVVNSDNGMSGVASPIKSEAAEVATAQEGAGVDADQPATMNEEGLQNGGNVVSNLNIGAYDIVSGEDVSVTNASNQAQSNPPNGHSIRQRLRDTPGAFPVPGPGFVPESDNDTNYEEYDTNHDPENDILEAEVNPVVEGYLPMTKKERRKQKRKEIYKHLKENAITLEDSAVKRISESGSRGEGEEIEKTSSNQEYCGMGLETFRKLCCVSLTLLVAVGIVVASVLGTQQNRNNDDGNETDEDNFDYVICGVDVSPVGGDVYDRYTIAQEIISEITPIEILENESSPQSRALSWIVCNDKISSDLLNNPDPSGKLPNQTNGFVISGNSGEAQVTRRYALAVLYLSTTENGPWNETGGYLDPELHECSWYRNFTRGNFPFGDFDPMGAVCQGDHDQDFLRDDGERKVERMTINFRVPNNMVGSLPMEFGYLVDVVNIFIESHPDMAGPIPHSIGHMTHLESTSILFMGPNFGGPLPESLFKIPALQHLTFTRNEGNWTLPETVEFVETPGLMTIIMFYSGFSGPLPRWLSQSNKMTELELSGNNFSGEIPDSFQYFSSLKYLSLFENRINSTLPSSLGELKSLTALVLGDNNIQGSIPSSIGKLTQLDLLHLGGNDMTSTIPQSFADLSVLKSLVLDSNRLNGTIEVLGSLKEVSTLFIHNNRFSGTIPGSLFSSTPHDNIHADFGNNLFRGVLPSEFGNLQNLTYLAATQNDFDPNSVDERICNNTPFLVMDCSSCSCCSNCCQNSNRYCDFHPNEYVLLGLECTYWYMHCGKPEQAYDVLPTD